MSTRAEDKFSCAAAVCAVQYSTTDSAEASQCGQLAVRGSEIQLNSWLRIQWFSNILIISQ